MSEIYGINELPKVIFPLLFKIIDFYQSKYPRLMDKLKCEK